MRPVYIAGMGQLPSVLAEHHLDEAEWVQASTQLALQDAGLHRSQIGFVCSGSSDYTIGRPFSFVMALDGVGAWPPIRESHVEMDGAFALYEAWVRLQHGDIDTAMVYAFGRSSAGSIDDVYAAQLDPYTVAPLGPRPVAIAALQARMALDSGVLTERAMAEAVARARARGAQNPNVPALDVASVNALLAAPYVASPLRVHDAARRTDGAAAVVLSTHPVGPRITSFEHRIEAHALGARDLVGLPALRVLGERARSASVDVAEIHTPYSAQEALVCQALRLPGGVSLNPSGGALVAETPFVAGLLRIIEATAAVRSGARRALAHTTGGPALQHNLVCALEAL